MARAAEIAECRSIVAATFMRPRTPSELSGTVRDARQRGCRHLKTCLYLYRRHCFSRAQVKTSVFATCACDNAVRLAHHGIGNRVK
jgi:hypothetical protein